MSCPRRSSSLPASPFDGFDVKIAGGCDSYSVTVEATNAENEPISLSIMVMEAVARS